MYSGGSVHTEEIQGDCSVISAIDGLAEEVIQWVRASEGMGIEDSFPGRGICVKAQWGQERPSVMLLIALYFRLCLE